MSRSLRPEEIELWRRVAATVRPRVGQAPKAISQSPAHPPKSARIPDGGAKISAPSKSKAKPVEKPAAPPPGKPNVLDARTLRDLRKRRRRVEARLDLHGLRVAEAHSALVQFLQRASAQGRRLVLVVTGKGRSVRHDPFQPYGVLRRQAPLWLSDPALAHMVSGFSPALPHDGGEGAFYVRLRRLNVSRPA